MNFALIETAEQLQAFCGRLRDYETIAFDTEFVSEDTYKPLLCLVQVATRDAMAIIDPLACGPIDEFWQLLIDPGRTVIVHAAREEALFCLRATGEVIPNLFDTQLAAGFLGHEYPISYANLVAKYTGRQLDKHETRSDWRQRPLSQKQLVYAIDDVEDLLAIHTRLSRKLRSLGREAWMADESFKRQEAIAKIEREESWNRLSGLSGLQGGSLSIAVALWRWRELEAKRRDVPPRRVLRDDLIIELAKRRSSDPRRISAVRGMQYSNVRNHLDTLTDIIAEAKDQPPPRLSSRRQRSRFSPPPMLLQLLSATLSYVCRTQKIAASLVATNEDLKDYLSHRLSNEESDNPPALSRGWRAEIIGDQIDQVLTGQMGLRIVDPLSDLPVQLAPLRDP